MMTRRNKKTLSVIPITKKTEFTFNDKNEFNKDLDLFSFGARTPEKSEFSFNSSNDESSTPFSRSSLKSNDNLKKIRKKRPFSETSTTTFVRIEDEVEDEEMEDEPIEEVDGDLKNEEIEPKPANLPITLKKGFLNLAVNPIVEKKENETQTISKVNESTTKSSFSFKSGFLKSPSEQKKTSISDQSNSNLKVNTIKNLDENDDDMPELIKSVPSKKSTMVLKPGFLNSSNNPKNHTVVDDDDLIDIHKNKATADVDDDVPELIEVHKKPTISSRQNNNHDKNSVLIDKSITSNIVVTEEDDDLPDLILPCEKPDPNSNRKKELPKIAKYLLNDLSPDLGILILKFLPSDEALSFRKSCKKAKSLFDDYPAQWKNELVEVEKNPDIGRRNSKRGGGYLLFQNSWGATFFYLRDFTKSQIKFCVSCEKSNCTIKRDPFYHSRILCENCFRKLLVDRWTAKYHYFLEEDLIERFEIHHECLLISDVGTLMKSMYEWIPKHLRNVNVDSVVEDDEVDFDDEVENDDEDDEVDYHDNDNYKNYEDPGALFSDFKWAIDVHFQLFRASQKELFLEFLIFQGHRKTDQLVDWLENLNYQTLGHSSSQRIPQLALSIHRYLILKGALKSQELDVHCFMHSNRKLKLYMQGKSCKNLHHIVLDCCLERWGAEYPEQKKEFDKSVKDQKLRDLNQLATLKKPLLPQYWPWQKQHLPSEEDPDYDEENDLNYWIKLEKIAVDIPNSTGYFKLEDICQYFEFFISYDNHSAWNLLDGLTEEDHSEEESDDDEVEDNDHHQPLEVGEFGAGAAEIFNMMTAMFPEQMENLENTEQFVHLLHLSRMFPQDD